MKQTLPVLSVCVLFFILLFPACDDIDYNPQGPIPEALLTPALVDYTQAQVDVVVETSLEEIYSPAPRDNGEPPEACDYVRFTRYRPMDDYSGNASDADACFLMVPGVLEGANGFDYIGRNMVYIAKTQYGMNIEVWGMDRRNNCIEDLTGTQAAEAASSTKEAQDLAIGYYYEGQAVNGKTFHGFLKNSDVPYLSEFGLAMDTRDMFTIISTMVPNREDRKAKVFVGGHSLGGIHTSVFAGWDLDGDPDTLDDAGFNNTAGIFCMDSTLMPLGTLIDSMLGQYLSFIPQDLVDCGKNMTELAYTTALYGLRHNLVARYVDGSLARMAIGSPIDAEIMGVIEVVGLLADRAPDDENTAIAQIPMSDHMDETLNMYLARDRAQLDSGVPSVLDFRFTNEALLGLFFDDDFTHIPMIKVSMGFLHGGPVVPKDPELGYKGQFVPSDAGPDLSHLGQGPLYSWANFDEVANADHPLHQDLDQSLIYTSLQDEVADIQTFARALYAGETNLVEWYFSVRRLVDLMAVMMDYGKKYGLYYLHPDTIEDLPQIEFPAGESMFDGVVVDSPYEALLGFNHMDPMFASAHTSRHRVNQVIYPLLDFAISQRSEP